MHGGVPDLIRVVEPNSGLRERLLWTLVPDAVSSDRIDVNLPTPLWLLAMLCMFDISLSQCKSIDSEMGGG